MATRNYDTRWDGVCVRATIKENLFSLDRNHYGPKIIATQVTMKIINRKFLRWSYPFFICKIGITLWGV